MKVSVVILNWNGENFLRKFLPVVVENSAIEGVEVVVADNASTDGSMDYVSASFPTVRTMIFDKNYGFAGGYNKVLANIDSEYYILLNSDVEVGPGWLLPLMSYMDSHTDVAACQPKILSYNDKTVFEHAGAAGGFIDYLGYPFCRGRILGKVEKDEGQYDTVADIFWATGACLMVRSEVFKKLGGLDDEFFAHMEEIDLCWRMRSRNMRIVCIPESVVYHVGGGALNVEHPRKTYLNFRNNLLLLYKNLPEKQFKRIFFYRFFLDYIAAFQLFSTGKPANAMSVFKARTDYRRMKKRFKTKRDENIFYSTNCCINEICEESIVVGYYFKGKKTFSKIIF
jgi:GT2 family glycosyltransferase